LILPSLSEGHPPRQSREKEVAKRAGPGNPLVRFEVDAGLERGVACPQPEAGWLIRDLPQHPNGADSGAGKTGSRRRPGRDESG
jgi:hypothetical protein